MSAWQYVALAAVSLLLVILIVWMALWVYDRARLAHRRRMFELKVIDSQLEKISENPESAPQAISALRSLGRIPAVATASPPPHDGAAVMRQLATFPPGAEIAQLGYRIFKWLLALTVVMTACLVMYGWATYPSDADVATAVGGQTATAEARTNAYTQLLAEWQQQLKDLGQLFLLTPVFPLLGTVIGYIFGVRKNNGEPDPDPKPGGGGGGAVVTPGASTTTPPGEISAQTTPAEPQKRSPRVRWRRK